MQREFVDSHGRRTRFEQRLDGSIVVATPARVVGSNMPQLDVMRVGSMFVLVTVALFFAFTGWIPTPVAGLLAACIIVATWIPHFFGSDVLIADSVGVRRETRVAGLRLVSVASPWDEVDSITTNPSTAQFGRVSYMTKLGKSSACPYIDDATAHDVVRAMTALKGLNGLGHA